MADEVTEDNPEVVDAPPAEAPDILALIAELLTGNPDGAGRLTEAYEMERDTNAETISGLGTRNGDTMTQLAAVEADRDAAVAQVESLRQELLTVKAGNFDKLMNGGDAAPSGDDGIASVPDAIDPADGDPDITPEEFISKYVK